MNGVNPISVEAALEHHRAGRLREAESIYRQVLARQPNEAAALDLLGVLCGQTGRLQEGISHLSRAAAISPNADAVFTHLGNLFRDASQPTQAVAAYQRALQLNPRSSETHNNLGNALIDLERYVDAAASYRAALRLNPRLEFSWANLGVALRALGQLRESVEAQRNALAINPNSAISHDSLGLALIDLGEVDESLAEHRRAVQLNPNSSPFHSNLSTVLAAKGLIDEAVAACRTAVKLNPADADALNNLGVAVAEQGNVAEAIACYREAIRLRPNFANAWCNLGMSLADEGRVDEARAAHERSVALRPADPMTRFNYGIDLLRRGELEQAWPHYECRWQCRGVYKIKPFRQPLWNGQPFPGKTLFLHSDQGLGDTIQFARYFPQVASMGERLLLGCDSPLRRLLKDVPGIEQIFVEGDFAPQFDLHLPVVSLPAVLNTTLATIPSDIPYLKPIRFIVEHWREKLASVSGMKIGLCWAGRAVHKNDRNRSMRLEQFAPLANDSITFISLQKGPPREQIANPPAGMRLLDFTEELQDLADTAGLVANLDLVISVDTSVVHLTGALGKPVWTLLPFNPDWRWMLDREDSPWYPTMRLFRQRKAGDWDDVIARVVSALANLK